MSDTSNKDLRGSRGANRATAIEPENLVSKLLFAFFSHDAALTGSLQVPELRATAIEKLLKVLGRLYRAIGEHDFDRSRHELVTDDIVQQYFVKKFNQYNAAVKAENVPFDGEKASKARIVFGAIASVGTDVFRRYEAASGQSAYIAEVQALIGLRPSDFPCDKQLAVLSQIEDQMFRRATKPPGAFSFDADYNVIIKTQLPKFFPRPSFADEARREAAVTGRFLAYRELFTTADDEYGYTREYVVIERRRPYGYVFRWETFGGKLPSQQTVNGVVIFTNGGFWLFGHANDPFQRIRVAAANLQEWLNAQSADEQNGFRSSIVLSHKEPGIEPAERRVVFRREQKNEWDQEPWANRTRSITREKLVEVLNDQELEYLRIPRSARGVSWPG